MKHTENIDNYNGSLKDLAKQVSNLKYNKLADFLNYLADELLKQSSDDVYNKKIKLATCLSFAAKNIILAIKDIDDAWRISKPFMKEENTNDKEKITS